MGGLLGEPHRGDKATERGRASVCAGVHTHMLACSITVHIELVSKQQSSLDCNQRVCMQGALWVVVWSHL